MNTQILNNRYPCRVFKFIYFVSHVIKSCVAKMAFQDIWSIIYPACYYCLFTSCKKVRLRKTIDKEYYSKGYILYLLVAGAKDYKVNVLHHYDKKNCIFPSQWFLIRSALHNPLPNWQYICGFIIAPCSDITIFWTLVNSSFNQSKKYIETNTKQHGCGHVQVLYRERIPIIFASNSIQTLWELLHT